MNPEVTLRRLAPHDAPGVLAAFESTADMAGPDHGLVRSSDVGSGFWTSRSKVPSGSSRAPIRIPDVSGRGGSMRGHPTVVSGIPACRH